jgi:UDP-N-acetyl-D-mannosaminuronic acid dehydrogenase
MIKEKICVIGLGYIGLPTAALLASKGYLVNGVDTNLEIVKNINNGRVHIKEKGLNNLVVSTIKSQKFFATSKPSKSDVFIIAVPTPISKTNSIPTPNITFVLDAVKSILGVIKKENLLIIESTIPVGTTQEVANSLEENGIDLTNLHIAHCPERVLPGNILNELIKNDRIIGGITKKSSSVAEAFYKTFVKGNIYKTDAKTAELCKLTENSFRDVNIAFANELSMICDQEQINTLELIELTNKHPRVNVLQPGPGVGGHCIAVDPWFIISQHENLSNLMKTSREVNIKKTDWVTEKIKDASIEFQNKNNKEAIIACFGITFKANVGDTRESPSIQIIEALKIKGYKVLIIDPFVKSFENFITINYEEAYSKADIFVFLVKHTHFEIINKDKRLADKMVLDFCGQLVVKQ